VPIGGLCGGGADRGPELDYQRPARGTGRQDAVIQDRGDARTWRQRRETFQQFESDRTADGRTSSTSAASIGGTVWRRRASPSFANTQSKSSFQAKRYADTPVGRPEIDKLRTAIQGDFDHGVFMTADPEWFTFFVNQFRLTWEKAVESM
jgi:hypothetical protein